jgi:hypothetical protein
MNMRNTYVRKYKADIVLLACPWHSNTTDRHVSLTPFLTFLLWQMVERQALLLARAEVHQTELMVDQMTPGPVCQVHGHPKPNYTVCYSTP